MRKALPIAILAAILVFFAMIYGEYKNQAETETGSPSTVKSSVNDEKIVIMLRAGLEADALKKLIAAYEKATGKKVEIQEISRDDYFTVMPTRFLAGSDEVDIAMIPDTYVGMLAGAGALEPLDDYLEKDRIDSSGDFLSLYGYNGRIYLIPTDVSTHFIYYRSDLIPNPPETWDEYLEIAKKFTKELNPYSPTKWGASLSGAVPEELPKEFNSILWSFNGDIVDENNNVFIDSPNSIQAGEYIRKLKDSRVISPETLSWGYYDVLMNLVEGNTAMAAPFWNAAYYEIKNSNGKFKDKIRFTLIPGVKGIESKTRRTPLRHSWTFGINANSLQKKASWAFLVWLMDMEAGRTYERAGGTPPRVSILLDPSLQNERPEFDTLIKSLYLGRNESSLPFYPGMVDIEAEALTKILTGNASPKDAFEIAAMKIRELCAKKDRK